jgi:hypothetical protein
MKRNILKSMIVAALLGVSGLAARFNTNASAPSIVQVPAAPRRSKDKRRHIKGMKSSNFSRYGRGLQNHFDGVRG